MLYLLVALAAPVAGPVLYGILHDRRSTVRLVDGFIYVAVPLLVAWQVLPHAWEERSAAVLVAVGAGLLLPAAGERISHVLHRHADDLALLVSVSGLALHALLEGAALVPSASAGFAFALAVALHRVPVGLVVWWLIRPRHGVWLAAAGVGSVVAATLLGYGLGTRAVAQIQGPSAELFQAFVGGSLLHVVFHQGRHDHMHEL